MDQSSAPWRVFDAPSSVGSATGPSAASGSPGVAATGATDQRIAIVGGLGALAVGALAVLIAVAGSGGETIDAPGLSGGALGSEGPGSAGGEIVVDVAGAVAVPGVYRLPIGARVGEAIEAAGGFGPRVDVERVGAELNLAATLTDGAQIRVPSRDERPGVGPGAGAGTGGAGGGAGGPEGQVVNLNTASQSELETLPGIGPVTATKIIESRSGSPFARVEELRERGLVGEKTFESIRALVSVR